MFRSDRSVRMPELDSNNVQCENVFPSILTYIKNIRIDFGTNLINTKKKAKQLVVNEITQHSLFLDSQSGSYGMFPNEKNTYSVDSTLGELGMIISMQFVKMVVMMKSENKG